MANYFRHFPKTPYIIDKNDDLNLVTNLIARVKFIDTVKNITASYFRYDISNDDTPESLSYKFYGSSSKHWIILLMNDIIDPQYDWYMNYESLNKYIEEKYYAQSVKYRDPDTPGQNFANGIEFSRNSFENFTLNKKYFIREERQILEFSSDTKIIETRETDFATWQGTTIPVLTKILTNSNSLTLRITTEKFFKTFYDLELEENERKRSVKVLREEYVRRVEEELKSLLGTG